MIESNDNMKKYFFSDWYHSRVWSYSMQPASLAYCENLQ